MQFLVQQKLALIMIDQIENSFFSYCL